MRGLKKYLTILLISSFAGFFASCGMSPGEDVISADPEAPVDMGTPQDPDAGLDPQDETNNDQPEDAPKPHVNPQGPKDLKNAGPHTLEEWEDYMGDRIPDYLKNSPAFQQASPGFKIKVYKNILKYGDQSDEMLLTHFGYVKPKRAGSPKMSGEPQFPGNGFLIGGLTSAPSPYFITGDCMEMEIKSAFICIRRPAEGENGKALTAAVDEQVFVDNDGNFYVPVGTEAVRVIAYVYYDNFAVVESDGNPNTNPEDDPRITVTTSNQLDEMTNGGIHLPDQEVLFYDSPNNPGQKDFHTDDEEGNPLPAGIRRIEFSMGLTGPGLTDISIQGDFLDAQNGQASVAFSVYKTVPVQIELAEMYVDKVNGNEKKVFQDGDTVPVLYSALDKPAEEGGVKTILNEMTFDVKLGENQPYSPGTRLVFENRDDDGVLQGHAVVGGTADSFSEMGLYTARLRLKPGFNHITIKGNTLNTINVTLFYDRTPYNVVTKSSTLIAANAENKAKYQFCFTPMGSQNCDKAPGLDNVEVRVNGKTAGTLNNGIGNENGVYNVTVTPQFGVNLVEVYSGGSDGAAAPDLVHSDAFLYGDPVYLVKDGIVKESLDTFTPRGVSLDISNALIKNEIKDVLKRYINLAETHDFVLESFRSTAKTVGYTCKEFIDPVTEKYYTTNGNGSIEFSDDFTIGSENGEGPAIEVTSVEAGEDGYLHLGLKINGLYGDADMKPIDQTSKQLYENSGVGTIPLSFAFKELTVNVAVGLTKDNVIDSDDDGVKDTKGLDIQMIHSKPDVPFVSWKTDLDISPLGVPVWVDKARNPDINTAAKLAFATNLGTRQFFGVLGASLTCGLEDGYNHPEFGDLGRSATDILKQLAYDPGNAFRYSFSFELFGSKKEFDLALNFLRSDLLADASGLHLLDVPVRVNSGQNNLEDAHRLAYVSRPKTEDEDVIEPIANAANQDLVARLGEDVLNNAILAFLSAKGLDINLDPRFYNLNNSTPSTFLLPTGGALAQDIDLNLDGRIDDNDKDMPILWEIRSDNYGDNRASVRTPLMISWLTPDQVAALHEEEQLNVAEHASPVDFFDRESGYFMISVPNLTIRAFPLELPTGNEAHLASIQYCKQVYSRQLERVENPDLETSGFCANETTILTPLSSGNIMDKTSKVHQCDNSGPYGEHITESDDQIFIPRWNGKKLSFDTEKSNVPIYEIKLNLQLIGRIAGVNQMKLTEDLIREGNAAKEQSVIHVQFAPKNKVVDGYRAVIQVVENNTIKSDQDIKKILDELLNAAFDGGGDACNTPLGEFRFALPENFELDPEPESILEDIGLESIDLTDFNVYEAQPFYLGVSAGIDLNFRE